MHVAVIGTGVTGLTCARRLEQAGARVVVYEAEARLGGHTNTVTVMEGERPVPIDTGFIVFNTRTYPRFVALLGELGVGWTPSEMSFSVRSERRDFEYAGAGLSTLYAQRRRLLSPRHHRMVADILRFFREAPALLRGDGGAGSDDIALGDWLAERRYSQAFIDDHLVPMVRAVWSTNREVALRFPAHFLARFFANHGFLAVRDRVGWLTIAGGAATYVRAIVAELAGEVVRGAPVERVVRTSSGGVVVHARGHEPRRFDHVVLACHADDALALVEAPTARETELVGAFAYQHNRATLHTDASVMPRKRHAWSSWNVHLDEPSGRDDGGGDGGACLTYWMNRLQPLAAARDYFVSLNHQSQIAPAAVLRTFDYRHPIFTPASVAAQARHDEVIDHLGLSYCGAYWRNGFHEDGVVAGERVAARLGGVMRAAGCEVAA